MLCEAFPDIASWVQQLGNRKVPESVLALAHGRSRLLYLNVHQLNEPVPEEEWLRANTKPIRESRFGLGVVTEFHPLETKTFSANEDVTRERLSRFLANRPTFIGCLYVRADCLLRTVSIAISVSATAAACFTVLCLWL